MIGPFFANEPLFHLVIAAPEGQAGVVANAPHVLLGLDAHVLQPLGVKGRIRGAGEDEILPHTEPHLVTKIVKVVFLVQSPAPHTQHVHIGVHGVPQRGAISISRHPGGKHVAGNPVGPFGEKGHAVCPKVKGLAISIRLTDELERAQANPPGDGIQQHTARPQLYREVV